MFAKVVCPTCGHQDSVPQERLGRRIECVNCQSPFTAEAPAGVGAAAAPPAAGTAQAGAPLGRTILASLEEPIRYSCPRCAKALEAPRNLAGQKHNCPGCGQRLQIPQPPAAAPPLNKTILATESQAAVRPSQAGPPPLPSAADVPLVEVVAEQPGRRERCLECGRDLTGHDRPLTCAKCGALFCSSACYRDHDTFAHGRKNRQRSERRVGFQCPYCGTSEPPYVSTQISSEGWVVFALLLVFCLPLFWIGLLITEERRHCADCGARLN